MFELSSKTSAHPESLQIEQMVKEQLDDAIKKIKINYFQAFCIKLNQPQIHNKTRHGV